MAVSENALSNYSSTISGFLPEVCFDQKAEHFERRYDSCALITFAWLNPYARQMSKIVQIIYFIFL